MSILSKVLLISVCLLRVGAANAEFIPSGKLEIHYINVGQGGSTLIIGPDGTRILYDFGAYKGDRDIVPYLRNQVGIEPEDGIHYAIVSHRDKDHYMGYLGMVNAGYDVHVANFGSGSTKLSSTINSNWLEPSKQTRAGEVARIPVGLKLSLGDGAELLVMAANGHIYGGSGVIDVSNENDRSIVLFLKYGNFHYVLDGDAGAGSEECTSRDTKQKDVQTHVARALLKTGLIDEKYGVDVMHVAHHGSESSTSASYYNMMKPEVGVISVGKKNKSYHHPREDVVDNVLLGNPRSECVIAPALKALFQTEHGEEGCLKTGCTSDSGTVIGDIKISTDGRQYYDVVGSGRVHSGGVESSYSDVIRVEFDEGMMGGG